MLSIKKSVIIIVFSGLSVFLTVVSAAQPKDSSNEQSSDVANTVDGAKVYTDNCSICHGDKGDGKTRAQGSLRPPPRNFTTLSAAVELTRDRMIHSVKDGRPGTGMMPHKDRLTEQEIVAVVDYIRNNFMNFPENKDSQQVTHQVSGEKIYSKNCSVCHGDRGTTAIWARSGLNPQPRDFTTAMARKELTRERMITSVTKGRPGTAMMPHEGKLSDREIEQVVDYIRTAFMSGPASVAPATQPSISAHKNLPQTGSPRMQGHPQMPGFNMPGSTSSGAAMGTDPHRRNPHADPHSGGTAPAMAARIGPVMTADMKAPMPKGLKGDVSKGREFYMNNCFTCHGVKGDGNGPRAHFNTPRPRNFTSEASRRMLNRERLFNSITKGKVGTVMPAWGKVLTDQQIANVAEFVFTQFIQQKVSKAENPDNKTNKKKAN